MPRRWWRALVRSVINSRDTLIRSEGVSTISPPMLLPILTSTGIVYFPGCFTGYPLVSWGCPNYSGTRDATARRAYTAPVLFAEGHSTWSVHAPLMHAATIYR